MPDIDIFISYASEDQPQAKTLAEALEAQGRSVWWDRDILAGSTFDDVIEEALGKAKCVVVMWSRHSVGKRWVKTEAAEGAKREILVPVLIEDVQIPLAFRRIQAENLINWDDTIDSPAFVKLLAAIKKKSPFPEPLPDQDIILIHRLGSLKRDLARVDQVRDYMQDIKNLLTDRSSSQLWDEILGTAHRHIRKYNTHVDAMRGQVLTSGAEQDGHRGQEAWRQYNETLRGCEDLFYETTEFLTGLVLRNALFQDAKTGGSRTSQVYRIADEMVQRAAELTNRSFRTAVPAHRDNVTRTLLCLIRLRFPGWSIWHLPLLAYEYGRLLIEQDTELINFVRKYPKPENVSFDADLDDLFSDIFATYYVGPAYAYVVTYLQLNPSVTSAKDAARAEVVFSTLDHVGQQEKGEHPYREVIAGLRRDWSTAIHYANKVAGEAQGTVTLSKEKVQCLAEFTRATLMEIRGYYNAELGYPAEHRYQGWKVANVWAGQWQGQLQKKGRELELPQGLGLLNALRDVLNAGWICRLNFKEDLDRLAEVMENTCRAIMQTSPMGKESKSETASSIGPR